MTKTLSAVLDEFAPEDRADIERRAAELIAEARTLAEMRKSLGLSQAAVAEALRTSQANVAKIESGRSDVMVSTIARIVGAMGGRMRMVVELPGRPPTWLALDGSGAEAPDPAPRKTARPKKAGSALRRHTGRIEHA